MFSNSNAPKARFFNDTLTISLPDAEVPGLWNFSAAQMHNKGLRLTESDGHWIIEMLETVEPGNDPKVHAQLARYYSHDDAQHAMGVISSALYGSHTKKGSKSSERGGLGFWKLTGAILCAQLVAGLISLMVISVILTGSKTQLNSIADNAALMRQRAGYEEQNNDPASLTAMGGQPAREEQIGGRVRSADDFLRGR